MISDTAGESRLSFNKISIMTFVGRCIVPEIIVIKDIIVILRPFYATVAINMVIAVQIPYVPVLRGARTFTFFTYLHPTQTDPQHTFTSEEFWVSRNVRSRFYLSGRA